MFSNDPRVALESLSNTMGTIGPVELRAVNTATPVRQWLGKFVKITPHHFGGEEYGVVFAVGSLEGRGHDDSLWAIWAFRAQRARQYFL